MSGLTRDELTNLAVGLPIVTAIVGVLAGLGLGFALGWGLKPAPAADPLTANVPDFTADQITFKCGQIQGEELKSANARIKLLQTERDEFEKKVAALQVELEQVASTPAPSSSAPRTGGTAAKASKLQKELDSARRQLTEVVEQLGRAEEEKRQLQAALIATTQQLASTEEALDVQVGLTEEAVQDALGQSWWRFLADSQLEICEKGNRKKLGRCREQVEAALQTGPVRTAFSHCVRSKQATPAVELLDRGESLPRFAKHLGEDSKVTKDWYIRLCDPTLPEARMGAPALRR